LILSRAARKVHDLFAKETLMKKNPFRFWMTGGAAMMLAAMSSGRALGADERPAFSRVSRYGIEETVSRITASAQRHGLPVLARWRHTAANERIQPSLPRLLIVLESSQGGTPVSMDAADAEPDLLLSLVVRTSAEGAIEVLVLRGSMDDLPDGIPDAVLHDLADLPMVVEDALAA
jgi:hypothetical protein